MAFLYGRLLEHVANSHLEPPDVYSYTAKMSVAGKYFESLSDKIEFVNKSMSRPRSDSTQAMAAASAGSYIGERIDREPGSEAEHFIRCPVCGGLIDMRELAQVFEHEGPLPHPTQDLPQ